METDVRTGATVTTRSAGIRFGLINALLSIVFFLILTIAAIDSTSGPWRWLGYLITAVIVFLAHKYYKDNTDGFMSYGQGVGIGFWIGLVSGIISSLFMYLYIKFIDASFLDLLKENQIEQMRQRGMSDEQIDRGLEFTARFITPESLLILGFVGAIAGTVIVALFVSIVTQKKNPEPTF